MCFLVFPELRWPGATIEGFAGSAEDSRFVLDAADFETYDSVGVSECLRSIHLRIPHRGMGKVSARSVLDVPVQVSDDGSWRAFAVYCNGDAGGGGEADEHEPAPLGVSTAAGDADNGLRDHVAGLSVAPPEDRGSWRILGDRRRGCRPSPAEEDDDAQQHGDFDDGFKVHFDNDGVILYEGGGTEIHFDDDADDKYGVLDDDNDDADDADADGNDALSAAEEEDTPTFVAASSASGGTNHATPIQLNKDDAAARRLQQQRKKEVPVEEHGEVDVSLGLAGRRPEVTTIRPGSGVVTTKKQLPRLNERAARSAAAAARGARSRASVKAAEKRAALGTRSPNQPPLEETTKNPWWRGGDGSLWGLRRSDVRGAESGSIATELGSCQKHGALNSHGKMGDSLGGGVDVSLGLDDYGGGHGDADLSLGLDGKGGKGGELGEAGQSLGLGGKGGEGGEHGGPDVSTELSRLHTTKLDKDTPYSILDLSVQVIDDGSVIVVLTKPEEAVVVLTKPEEAETETVRGRYADDKPTTPEAARLEAEAKAPNGFEGKEHGGEGASVPVPAPAFKPIQSPSTAAVAARFVRAQRSSAAASGTTGATEGAPDAPTDTPTDTTAVSACADLHFEALPEEVWSLLAASGVDVDGVSRHASPTPAPPKCHHDCEDAGSERRVAAEHAGVGEDCAKPEKEAENEVREEKAHKVAFAATLSAMSIDAFGDLACAEFAAGVATGLGVPRGGVRVTSAGARAGSDFVEIIVHANDESNNASATGLTYDDITKSAPPHLRCVVSLFPLCHSSSGAPPSLQAETSKKPTAVDTAPRHRVRKTLSTASFFGRSVKFCCD